MFEYMYAVLLLSLVSLVATTKGKLNVDIEENGDYSISIDNRVWLNSGPISFFLQGRSFSTSDGTIKIANYKPIDNGTDILGDWTAIYMYLSLQNSTTTLKISFVFYHEHSFILLKQHYSRLETGTNCGDANKLSSAFPTFRIEPPSEDASNLGFLAFGGIMFGDTQKKIGIWGINDTGITSGLDSGPLVLFESSTDHVLIISPFDNFMSSSAMYSGSHQNKDRIVSWGIMGSIESIPENYEHTTIIYHSNEGINKAFEGWGKTMRLKYSKTQHYRESDITLNYVGYWTDRGAYYYYKTDTNSTYEQTLINIHDYLNSMKIPYRYLQYDSWFYFKGPKGGVTQWTGMPTLFPNGLSSIYKQTGLPVSAHNRWWSDKTTYAKQNGGNFTFIIEKATHLALPIDQSFWNYLMADAKKWGLVTYEQDWINTEFDGMQALHSDITIGRTWLLQMGRAARSHDITIQYCMCPTRAALQSLEIEAVTQGRVTDDYQPGNNNWKVGVSSLLADALGVAPFKDTFWTEEYQPGNPYKLSEPYSELNSLVATLTTGPVGISDSIGHINKTIVMRSCNANGLLLKPSVPIKAIDEMIKQRAFENYEGEIWSTYSDLYGLRFSIVLAVQVNETEVIDLSPNQLHLNNDQKYFSYNMKGDILPFSISSPLSLTSCSRKNYCLRYTSPILTFRNKALILLGELGKWVPMSKQRVKGIELSQTEGIKLTLTGAPWELLDIFYSFDGVTFVTSCTLSNAGNGIVYIP